MICPECREDLGTHPRRIYKHTIQEFNLEDKGARQLVADAKITPGERSARIVALLSASIESESADASASSSVAG